LLAEEGKEYVQQAGIRQKYGLKDHPDNQGAQNKRQEIDGPQKVLCFDSGIQGKRQREAQYIFKHGRQNGKQDGVGKAYFKKVVIQKVCVIVDPRERFCGRIDCPVCKRKTKAENTGQNKKNCIDYQGYYPEIIRINFPHVHKIHLFMKYILSLFSENIALLQLLLLSSPLGQSGSSALKIANDNQWLYVSVKPLIDFIID
jgi:Uncharacterized protein conserved in bacteria